MVRFSYKIDGQELELGTNPDGSSLFVWSNSQATWKQISASHVARSNRMDDKRYVRRAIYSYYRRHFLI